MTYPESAAVAGGDQATAAQYNNLRYDALNQFIVPGGRIKDLYRSGTRCWIRYKPHLHNRISLWDGSRWAMHEFSDLEDDSTGVIAFFAQYDVFVYDNAGTLALEVQKASATTTLSADVSAGSSVVCAVASTDGFSVGDLVWVQGPGTYEYTGNGEVTNVTAVNPGVSITVASLAATHLSGHKVSCFSRNVSLGTQNGRLVKSGDATRLYVGTVCFTIESTLSGYRYEADELVWNRYNQILKPFYLNIDSTYSHTYASTTPRIWGLGTSYYLPLVIFLVGIDNDQPVRAEYRGMVKAAAAGNRPQIGLGLDAVSAFDSEIELAEIQSTALTTLTGGAWVHPGAGLHALYALEAAASGSGTFNDISIKGGIFA